jgi:hypothetical protein
MTLVQLAPAASGLVQLVLARLKELAPPPVMVVEAVKVTEAEVLFFSVMVCVAALVPTVVEGNVMEPGVMVSPVFALAPVPVNVTVCAEDDAESK